MMQIRSRDATLSRRSSRVRTGVIRRSNRRQRAPDLLREKRSSSSNSRNCTIRSIRRRVSSFFLSFFLSFVSACSGTLTVRSAFACTVLEYAQTYLDDPDLVSAGPLFRRSLVHECVCSFQSEPRPGRQSNASESAQIEALPSTVALTERSRQVNLDTALFLVGFGVAAPIAAPLSELAGRCVLSQYASLADKLLLIPDKCRIMVYLVSLAAFALLEVGAASCVSIASRSSIRQVFSFGIIRYTPVSRLTLVSYSASSPAVLRRRRCRMPPPALATSGPPVNARSSSPSLPPLGSSGLVSVSTGSTPAGKSSRRLTLHRKDRSCDRWLDRFEQRFVPMDRLGPINLVRHSLSLSRGLWKQTPERWRKPFCRALGLLILVFTSLSETFPPMILGWKAAGALMAHPPAPSWLTRYQ
jgi:hypothetical protein